MFEILIIDRNKNKNYNWDYQSIIAQITGITNQLFTIHFIWKAPETRWFPVPFGCPHSRSPPSPLMGKPSAGYDLATAVVGLWLEWPPINPTYTYTLRVYIYICMYACMDGWMDELVYWGSLQSITNIAMNQLVLSGDRLSTQHCSEQLLGEVPLLPVGSFNFTVGSVVNPSNQKNHQGFIEKCMAVIHTCIMDMCTRINVCPHHLFSVSSNRWEIRRVNENSRTLKWRYCTT